jgi:hypothetical protein
MKKIRIAALLLAAALVAAALAGCGDAKAQTGETKTQTGDNAVQNQDQQNQQQPPGNGRGIMAKVVSLDGDQLIVILAETPGGGGTQPANGTPPAMGTGQENGTPPAIGPRPENGGKIQFTGENVTYTLSGDVKVTKGAGSGSSEIDLSELAADDVITFTTTTGDDGSEVVDSIQVLE